MARMIWAAIGIAMGAAAIAQTAIPQSEIADTKPDDFIYVAATSQDRVGRVMTPVFVNGVGPFAFVVDTGASSTVIAPRVARRLSLQVDTSNTKLLRGITGSEIVPTVNVSNITAGGISLENTRLPVVEPRVFADADGIFGADAFGRGCLVVSFQRAKVAILSKPCPRADDNWEKLRARLRFGGLVVADAHIGSVRAVAIIDTGAERSLGNPALLAALRERKKISLDSNRTQVYSATSQIVFGDLLVTPSLRMGGLSVGRFHVVYGDFEVFKIWDVADRPAIVLGIDVLGQMDAIMIDYTRSEVLVLPRSSASGVTMKRRGMPTRLPRN
ncbi:MAG: clan AA aspartic protease [Steroidobacteraceae bacterium]|nr:clan AA aspartic protease [Steroidobacteraceae bacterium]